MALIVDIEKKLGSFSMKVNMHAGNETTALLGASGSGKSMTLKCVAGIEKPDRGYIELDGTVLYDSEKKICLPPQKRRVGYLFQQYALFPNMTVRQNIACGIREKTKNRSRGGRNGYDLSGKQEAGVTIDSEERVAEIIRTMNLEGLEEKLPSQISGGEQQRTALARILVNDPEVLLLDEPFSALDTHLRFRLERELRDIMHRFGKPVLLVSHDRDEVYRLADRIAIIKAGTVEAIGTKYEVFADPQTADGAKLTGCKNISRIRKLNENTIIAEEWGITLRTDRPSDGMNFAGIRMHDLVFMKSERDSITENAGKPQNRDNYFACCVVEEIENPFSYTIMIRPNEAVPESLPIGVELDKKLWQSMRSEEVHVYFPPEKILLLR